MLFLKRLSDAFDEAREVVIGHYLQAGKTQERAETLAQDEDEHTQTFFVPERARRSNLKDLKHDIGPDLNKATEAIEEANPTLEGVLVSIEFNVKSGVPDNKLRDLLSHFCKYRLRNSDFDRPDLLGAAYEYVIKQFAYSEGKKGGAFYTPSEVVQLLVALLKPHARLRNYDPTVGSGGRLIQTHHYLAKHGTIRGTCRNTARKTTTAVRPGSSSSVPYLTTGTGSPVCKRTADTQQYDVTDTSTALQPDP